jgi:hypothetical protein
LQDAADVVEPFNEQSVTRYIPDAGKYTVDMGLSSAIDASAMDWVAKTKGADWRFNIYKDRSKRRFIGVFDGRRNPTYASLDEGQLRILKSPDFRSIRLFCEGRYKLTLAGLSEPKNLNLAAHQET